MCETADCIAYCYLLAVDAITLHEVPEQHKWTSWPKNKTTSFAVTNALCILAFSCNVSFCQRCSLLGNGSKHNAVAADDMSSLYTDISRDAT